MVSRTLSAYILLSITVILIMTVVFYFGHATTISQADEVLYNSLELISTSGVFDESIYNNLMDDLDNLSRGSTGSRYTMQVKLEKRISNGLYDTFIEDSRTIDNDIKNSEIVGIPLEIGDRLTIQAKDTTPTLFGSLMNAPAMLYKNRESEKGFRGVITVSGSTVISGDAYNMHRGYDVLADIDKYSSDSKVAVKVITDLNANGRVYGTIGHPGVGQNNPHYGDEPSERGNINTATGEGVDFIWSNGYFTRLVEEDEGSNFKTIVFIQH